MRLRLSGSWLASRRGTFGRMGGISARSSWTFDNTAVESYPQFLGRKMCFPRAESILVVPAVTTPSGPGAALTAGAGARRRCAGWGVTAPEVAAQVPHIGPCVTAVRTQAVLTPFGEPWRHLGLHGLLGGPGGHFPPACR